VPSALIIDENRIFLSGGYNSGAMMIRLNGQGQDTEIEQLFKLSHTKFGAEQHTPILYKDHIYGIRPSGEMTCLDLEGNVVWASGKKKTFGLGPYLLADGLLFCVEGHKATLHMVEATPDGYEELGSMEALDGPDAWAPMALAGGRLIVRDLTEVVCLKLPKTGT
jgi:outer membrane protein assembly factor BamB